MRLTETDALRVWRVLVEEAGVRNEFHNRENFLRFAVRDPFTESIEWAFAGSIEGDALGARLVYSGWEPPSITISSDVVASGGSALLARVNTRLAAIFAGRFQPSDA